MYTRPTLMLHSRETAGKWRRRATSPSCTPSVRRRQAAEIFSCGALGYLFAALSPKREMLWGVLRSVRLPDFGLVLNIHTCLLMAWPFTFGIKKFGNDKKCPMRQNQNLVGAERGKKDIPNFRRKPSTSATRRRVPPADCPVAATRGTRLPSRRASEKGVRRRRGMRGRFGRERF